MKQYTYDLLVIAVVTVMAGIFSTGCGRATNTTELSPEGCSVVQIPVGDPRLPKGGVLINCGGTIGYVSNG